MSDILNLIGLIVIFGVVMWVINAYIPMPPPIKNILNIVVVIIIIIYVLQFFGLIKTIFPTLRIFK